MSQFKLVTPVDYRWISLFPFDFGVYLTNLHILFTVYVVFAGRLVCSVNMLYMELSYTGSLDQSTRASEHVTVQISCAYKTTAGYHTFFKFI